LSGWYAITGNTNYTATIDPLNTVTETSETDNAKRPLSFSALGPTSLPSKFAFRSIDDHRVSDWVITSYVDLDPNAGTVRTIAPASWRRTQQRHRRDIPSFAAQDTGNNHVLARRRVVTSINDAPTTAKTPAASTPPIPSPSITGNGWKTIYSNVALNSFTVRSAMSSPKIKRSPHRQLRRQRAPHLHSSSRTTRPRRSEPQPHAFSRRPRLSNHGCRRFSTGNRELRSHDDILEKPVDTAIFPATMAGMPTTTRASITKRRHIVR